MPDLNDMPMDFERLVPDRASPGQMLKMAREIRHLSPDDIAKQLNLRVQWILDIENDHYTDAPAIIYVKGYLQSYARLVGVPSDEVLSAFKAMKFDEKFAKRKPQQKNRVKTPFEKSQAVFSYDGARGKIKRWKFYVAAVILLVAVLIFAVWFTGVNPAQRMAGLSINGMSKTSDQLQLDADVMAQGKVHSSDFKQRSQQE